MQAVEAWSLMNPGAALAAGLPLDPTTALDMESARTSVLRAASAQPVGPFSPEERVLAAAAAQAATWMPYQGIREALECVRAEVYSGRASAQPPIWDESIARALPRMVSATKAGTLLERVFAKNLLDGLSKLATDAGFNLTASEAGRFASEEFADIPLDPDWDAASALGPLFLSIGAGDHARLLRDAYGFPEAVEAMDAEMLADLKEECAQLRENISRISPVLPGRPQQAEDVARTLRVVRGTIGPVLDLAKTMTTVALDEFDSQIIALDEVDRAVLPEATPAAMLRLVTEGEEYLAGGLTDAPRAYCFITEDQCDSVYTLANVVYHELAHCWNMLKSSRSARHLPEPLRVSNTLGTALLEGIATLREWEVYDLYRHSEGKYAGLFDFLNIPRHQIADEFEFDTRYWRIARMIRALFDFRVVSRRQNYSDFVREMAWGTALSPARLHGFCFSFFEKPGYAPCYAVGAKRVAQLQRDIIAQRTTPSLSDFNARLSGAGLIPMDMWISAMS